MILTDEQIRGAVQAGTIVITPFSSDCVQPASYDLRVGGEGFTSSTKSRIDLQAKGFLVLQPGDFSVVLTRERIELDARHAARFALRGSLARKGVIAAIGPQIDPGFRGRLHVGLVNLSPNPITLGYNEHFCTVEFHLLSEDVKAPYQGPYQDQDTITSQDIDHIIQGEGIVYSQVVQSLASLNRTVAALNTRMTALFWVLGIFATWVTLLFTAVELLKV